MWLCGTCHREVHSQPFEARSKGFIVSRAELNPGSIPVHTYYGAVILDCHGFFNYHVEDKADEQF